MSGKIQIDHELLTTHAGRVDTVASEITQASDAASSTNMGGGAFGVMCSFLVAPATLCASAAQSAITAAGGMVTRSATEVRGVGSDFAQLESDLSAGIKSMEAGL